METKVLSLSCNHCGASLDVPEGTRFLTCSYCSSKLQIEHSGGSYYTSVLEQMQKHAEAVASDLETIKLQNELERVDREWALQRDTFLVHRKGGIVAEPDQGLPALKAILVVMTVITIVINVIALAILLLAWLFGGTASLIFAPISLFGMVAFWMPPLILYLAYRSAVDRAGRFRQAQAAYMARRENVLRKMKKS